MTAIRAILVIVDSTAKQHPALAKAGLLAEKFSARLDLFACDTKASQTFARRSTRAIPLHRWRSISGPCLNPSPSHCVNAAWR